MKNRAAIVEALKALTKKWYAWDKVAKDLIETTVSPTVIERDGKIVVSAEDGLYWADYYGEFHGGDMYIDPILEAFAKERGLFWEWENPGAISLHEA